MGGALYMRLAQNTNADSPTEPTGGAIKCPGLVSIYWDTGYSGNDMKRPGLLSLIEDIEAGKISTVTVGNISELSRSLPDTLALFGLFKEYGVELYTTSPDANVEIEIDKQTASWMDTCQESKIEY